MSLQNLANTVNLLCQKIRNIEACKNGKFTCNQITFSNLVSKNGITGFAEDINVTQNVVTTITLSETFNTNTIFSLASPGRLTVSTGGILLEFIIKVDWAVSSGGTRIIRLVDPQGNVYNQSLVPGGLATDHVHSAYFKLSSPVSGDWSLQLYYSGAVDSPLNISEVEMIVIGTYDIVGS